ncbi:PAS domain S-box protein [Candidatus Kapabacteria bacterium]|nr:PAS domain S-box protein [Candidatus Kapabacteria bacterium]
MLTDIFINRLNKNDSEKLRKSRLYFILSILSFVFPILIIALQDNFREELTYIMILLVCSSFFGICFLKFNGNLKFLGNFYSFITWISFSFIIIFTGGVMSAAYQWLIVSIIPAYIFTSLKNGHLWFLINFITAIFILYLSSNAVIGLMADISNMEFLVNAAFGLGLILFVPIIIIFYSQTNESVKSNLKNINFDLIEQEKIAKQSEQRFRVIAENFPNGSIVIINKDYVVTNAYGTLTKVYKDITNSHLGNSMKDNLGEIEFHKRKPSYDLALAGEQNSFESEYEGEYYYNSLSPLRDLNGEINRFLVASQIISDVKKAEQEIKNNQFILRKIIDTAPIFISRLDKNGFYLIVNDTLSSFLGYDCEQMIGKHYKELFSENMVKNLDDRFNEIQSKKVINNTARMTNPKTNKTIYNNYIISAINDINGNFDGVVIIGIDITELKQIELDLTNINQHINESIQYATRIQKGLLGDKNELKNIFPNSFVFFQPKDTLSGDFYWCAEWQNKIIVIAGDCTGHGVPGALMTTIGINFINEIVYTYGMVNPDMILYQLDKMVTDTLVNSSSEDKIQDGMDMSVLVFDKQDSYVSFAGAKNPLFICKSNGDCNRIRGTKYPIGSTHYGNSKVFETHKIEIEKGDMLYIYSDGFQDQMGGHNGKKYMAKNFRDYLNLTSKLDVAKQEILLEKSFNEWKLNREQTDDVLVIGIQIDE